MALHGDGRVHRTSRIDEDRDFPAQVESGEIVMDSGDHHTVADENHRSFDGSCGRRAWTDRSVDPELQRLGLAATDQFQAGPLGDDLESLELHELEVALRAGGLEAELLKLLGDVFRGFSKTV